MKNYKKYNINEQVIIEHGENKGAIGKIMLVRNSFCRIIVNNKEKNYTYGQFKKQNTSLSDI